MVRFINFRNISSRFMLEAKHFSNALSKVGVCKSVLKGEQQTPIPQTGHNFWKRESEKDTKARFFLKKSLLYCDTSRKPIHLYNEQLICYFLILTPCG